MNIAILSLFPQMFAGPFEHSIIKRAIKAGLVGIDLVNFREFSEDKHQAVDDIPYGGGAGMVIKPEPVFAAVEHLKSRQYAQARVVLTSPQGARLDQQAVRRLSKYEQLIVICGHYEGFDQRICDHLVDEQVSIGDYVLTGGELPAMVLVDSIVRVLPGVLGNEQSHQAESFEQGLLDFPHYTRPETFRQWKVPEILLSGHHGNIARWRHEQAVKMTARHRPDLIEALELSPEEKQIYKKEDRKS